MKNNFRSRKTKSIVLTQVILLLFFQVFSDLSFASGDPSDSAMNSYLLEAAQPLPASPLNKLTNNEVLYYLSQTQNLPSELGTARESISQAIASDVCAIGGDPKDYLERLREYVLILLDAALDASEDVIRGRMTPTEGITFITRLLREISGLVDYWCSNCLAMEILNMAFRGILRTAQAILEVGPVEPNVLRDFVRIVAEITRSFNLCKGIITSPVNHQAIV